jgi:hypothetical protein
VGQGGARWGLVGLCGGLGRNGGLLVLFSIRQFEKSNDKT